ncbi:hypothetical protein KZQ38_21720 [Saccharothrix sp. SC076]|nr:hypothetical protein [Saccharothrix obliqua]
MLGVLCVVVVFGVRMGEVVIARHRAGAAADLAALAAGGQVLAGKPHECGKARWVAERMGVELVSCEVFGTEVVVEVRGFASVFGTASARARAGAGEG